MECFNRTLIPMLAKMVEGAGKDWDQRLLYVLFSYRASQQPLTRESPFFVLYGRDPRLPDEDVLSPMKTRTLVDLKDYGRNWPQRCQRHGRCLDSVLGRPKRSRSRITIGTRSSLALKEEIMSSSIKTGEARTIPRTL